MHLRRQFGDNKIILVYWNALNQMNLSCPFNDGSNRTGYKTFKILNSGAKKQVSQGRCCSKYCRRTIAKV